MEIVFGAFCHCRRFNKTVPNDVPCCGQYVPHLLVDQTIPIPHAVLRDGAFTINTQITLAITWCMVVSDKVSGLMVYIVNVKNQILSYSSISHITRWCFYSYFDDIPNLIRVRQLLVQSIKGCYHAAISLTILAIHSFLISLEGLLMFYNILRLFRVRQLLGKA